MKLAFSNIAWEAPEEATILPLLRARRFEGIEVAPTKLWPGWVDATPANAARARRHLNQEGFEVPSMQSLLFGKPELSIFGDRKAQVELQDHLRLVAALAYELGARRLVFGSPKNRVRGEIPYAKAFDLAVDAFSVLAEICGQSGAQLCLEANPPKYHCDFMTDLIQTREVVRAVGSVHLGLHLDTACAQIAEEPMERIEGIVPLLRHVHVSEPWLEPVAESSEWHRSVSDVLRRGDYRGWATVEMASSGLSSAIAVDRAAEVTFLLYG